MNDGISFGERIHEFYRADIRKIRDTVKARFPDESTEEQVSRIVCTQAERIVTRFTDVFDTRDGLDTAENLFAHPWYFAEGRKNRIFLVNAVAGLWTCLHVLGQIYLAYPLAFHGFDRDFKFALQSAKLRHFRNDACHKRETFLAERADEAFVHFIKVEVDFLHAMFMLWKLDCAERSPVWLLMYKGFDEYIKIVAAVMQAEESSEVPPGNA